MNECYLEKAEEFFEEQKSAVDKINLQSFSLLKVIGKGSYAKVVLVRKKDTQKIFALKILKKTFI